MPQEERSGASDPDYREPYSGGIESEGDLWDAFMNKFPGHEWINVPGNEAIFLANAYGRATVTTPWTTLAANRRGTHFAVKRKTSTNTFYRLITHDEWKAGADCARDETVRRNQEAVRRLQEEERRETVRKVKAIVTYAVLLAGTGFLAVWGMQKNREPERPAAAVKKHGKIHNDGFRGQVDGPPAAGH